MNKTLTLFFTIMGAFSASLAATASPMVKQTSKAHLDLAVELKNEKPESIRFATETRAGKDVHLVTYFIGGRKLKERVVPDSIYASMKDGLPSALKTSSVGTCLVDVTVQVAKGAARQLCSAKLSPGVKDAFAKWYSGTRDKLFD